MSIEDIKAAAKVMLSGEPSRRRGYLSRIHTTWDGFALTGTLAIWAFLVQWDALKGTPPNQELFANQIAWASALSSLLLGFWRLYARHLDNSIISLYPVIYLSERALLPDEICSIKLPKVAKSLELPNGVKPLSKDNMGRGVKWVSVYNRNFRGRGHSLLDWIAVLLIVAFGAISVYIAWRLEVITIALLGKPHIVGLLLIGNAIALTLVIAGWAWWRSQERKWPIPQPQTEA